LIMGAALGLIWAPLKSDFTNKNNDDDDD